MDVEQDQPDGATKAFTELRDKLAGLTRAVDSMAGEWKALAIPDYSATLEKLVKEMKANAARLERMAEHPALQQTPQSLSIAILKAGSASRAADHAALANATTAFQNAHQTLTKSLVSARTANEQDKRLKKVSVNCLIAGMVIWAIVPGPIARAVPAGWHVPERLAARALGMDAWNAGQRLMLFAHPAEWKAMAATNWATQKSRDVIAKCRVAANKTRTAKKCSFWVEPENSNPE